MRIRKGHVKRFFSEDKSSYVDVLRLDEIELTSSVIEGVRGQKQILTLLWDDVNSEASEPYRTYDKITIRRQDFGEFVLGQDIDLNRITSTVLDLNGQRIQWEFNNDENTTTRQISYVGVISRGDDPPFTRNMEWNAYKNYMASHGVPSEYGTGLTISLIETMEQLNAGQRSFLTFNQEDVVKFIGNNALPPDTYMLDPFQIIVNAFWGSPDYVYVGFAATWWGFTPSTIPCSPDEYSAMMAIIDASDLAPITGSYSPLFFSTQGELRPSIYHGAGPDGVTDIGGTTPGDKYEISGMPAVAGSASSSPLRALFMNQDDWYNNPDIVGEDNRMSRVTVSGMSATFSLRSPKLLFRRYCEKPVSYEPGALWQPLDNRGFGYTGSTTYPFVDPDIAFRDAYSFEVASQTFNFSGVRVRRIADGKLYKAVKVLGPGLDSMNQSGVTIEMEPVKGTGK